MGRTDLISPQLAAPAEPKTNAIIRNTRPGSLIGYWPLDDPKGSTSARDASGRGFRGTITNALPGKQAGLFRPAFYFDGAGDFVDVYSAGLAAVFSGLEGTLLGFGMLNSTTWADGTLRVLVGIGVDATANYVRLGGKQTGVGSISHVHVAGGATKTFAQTLVKDTSPMMMTLTWSLAQNKAKYFHNGAQWGGTQAGVGTWAGAIASTRCTIGNRITAGGENWLGYIWDVALWREALSASEIMAIWLQAKSILWRNL